MKKRIVCLILAVMTIFSCLPAAAAANAMDSSQSYAALAAKRFSDVSSGAYYAAPVGWAVSNNITNGISKTHFGVNDTCTRAQIVTFLWRMAGSPKGRAATAARFRDVSARDYYYDAVCWAVERGITNGTTDSTFSPGASCTRGQIVTFLHRYADPSWNYAYSELIYYFRDVPTSAYFFGSVNWAYSHNITTGTSGTPASALNPDAVGMFSPNDSCTRAQAVTFLYRMAAYYS